MDEFARKLPKAELHLHIEGTLEPQMMFDLAERNGYELPFADLNSVKEAYEFTDLQSFLDIYYQGAAVLQTAQDFYELTVAYFDRVAEDGVRHAEVFFDPQTHTERDVGFEVFMEGFRAGMEHAEVEHGISSSLILCFLRHLPAESALETMRAAANHLDGVVAVGLDSSEVGFPPAPFLPAYELAYELGLEGVAHAGEEGPPTYIWSALDDLGVKRIDHGVRCLEDPVLVERLVRERVPLTVCPSSNVALRVVDRFEDHPFPQMLGAGLVVSANSDDPAYFGGYVGDNYAALGSHLDFTHEQLARVAANSIESSFLSHERKSELTSEITNLVNR